MRRRLSPRTVLMIYVMFLLLAMLAMPARGEGYCGGGYYGTLRATCPVQPYVPSVVRHEIPTPYYQVPDWTQPYYAAAPRPSAGLNLYPGGGYLQSAYVRDGAGNVYWTQVQYNRNHEPIGLVSPAGDHSRSYQPCSLAPGWVRVMGTFSDWSEHTRHRLGYYRPREYRHTTRYRYVYTYPSRRHSR